MAMFKFFTFYERITKEKIENFSYNVRVFNTITFILGFKRCDVS